MAVGLKLPKKFRMIGYTALGITARALIMICVNLALIYVGVISLPTSYANIPIMATLLFGAFNAVQGTLTVIGGYAIYEAIKRRGAIQCQREVD